MMPGMDVADLRRWFDEYAAAFAGVVRGDIADPRHLLTYYAIPLLFSSDAGTRVLGDEAAFLAFAHEQADALRSAGYDRSEALAVETEILNRSCVLHRGRFSRLRTDGGEIARATFTYLITEGPGGRRISVLVVHSPV